MPAEFTKQFIGQSGEEIAAAHLVQKGFQILKTNWRAGRAEIDIVAEKAGTLHFVEVKTRTDTDFGHPEDKVNKQKLRQMKQAAEVWLFQQPQWTFIQFDIISIILNSQLEVVDLFMIEDVF